MREEFDTLLMEDLRRQREALGRVEDEIGSVSEEIKALLDGKLKVFEKKLNQIEGTVISTSTDLEWSTTH